MISQKPDSNSSSTLLSSVRHMVCVQQIMNEKRNEWLLTLRSLFLLLTHQALLTLSLSPVTSSTLKAIYSGLAPVQESALQHARQIFIWPVFGIFQGQNTHYFKQQSIFQTSKQTETYFFESSLLKYNLRTINCTNLSRKFNEFEKCIQLCNQHHNTAQNFSIMPQNLLVFCSQTALPTPGLYFLSL